MNNNAVNFSELLEQNQKELSINSRLFDIIVSYIDESKQGRVKKLFQQIAETDRIKKQCALGEAIKKKLYEPVKEPVIDYVSLIEIKNVIKNRLPNLNEEYRLKWAVKTKRDPEMAAIEMINVIMGQYTRIHSCNVGLETSKTNVKVDSTFTRKNEFDAQAFMKECEKKEGASMLAIEFGVINYYPSLAYDEHLTIELFQDLIRFNILQKKAERTISSPIRNDKFSIDDLREMSELAKKLVATELLYTVNNKDEDLEDLFDKYGFKNIYEAYQKTYDSVKSVVGDKEGYTTKLLPDMVKAEINVNVSMDLTTINFANYDEVIEYATRYCNAEEEKKIKGIIETNRKLIKKYSARVHNDSIEEDLNEDEVNALSSQDTLEEVKGEQLKRA